MKAVVTGASGFLGHRVVERLVHEGVKVVCLVRQSSNLNELKNKLTPMQWELVSVVPCKLDSPESYSEHIDSNTVIYHVAAALNGNTSTLVLNTVIPTRRIVEVAIEKQVQRFVLVSSMGIYGPQKVRSGSIINEESPLDALPHKRDAYTYTKFLQEKLCREARDQEKLPLVIIRPGVIFGPGRGIVSGRVGLKFGSMLIRMGGWQQLPYTFVDNCAQAVVNAGLIPDIEGQIFNVIDDNLPRGRDIVRICRKHGQKLRQLIIPGIVVHHLCGIYEKYSRWTQGQVPPVLTSHRSKAMWKSFKYSNTKAKQYLKWDPIVPMSEALRISASTPVTESH